MEKDNIDKLIMKIYNYYPIGLKYGTLDYMESKEYLARKRKVSLKNDKDEYRKELYESLCAICKGYSVVDWTEEKAGCYEFKILLHKNQGILDDDIELIQRLGNQRYDIRVFVSALEPVFYLFEEKTIYNPYANSWEFITVNRGGEEQEKIESKIIRFFEKKGIEKIKVDIAKKGVKGIETELKYFNKATVFDCLFTDLVAIN
ncbi:hypothetical protein [Dorea sp. D27]|uniref:hypothetical protein n=1 Tax=Dorea sp. D27 TaxID=658665 RepID=UPI0006737A2D|nr:hypothetical protein [Dorea sp. D27]KMZ54869.1 hypothetical protein HMPREF0980_01282 [Dorea sp. D27]